MNAAPIDIPRLIRIATLLFAILGGSLVYFAFEPRVDAAQIRLDETQADLRSEEVAFAAMPRLRAERAELEHRYNTAFVRNPEAVFLRELASTVSRHDITLVATTVAQPATKPAAADAHRELFTQTQVTLELRGSYAPLLAGIRDLSNGSAIVSVDAPTLRRDADSLIATVPVTIYEPSPGNAP